MKLTRLFIAAYAAFLALPAHVFAAEKSSEDQPLNLDDEVAKHADPAGGASGGGSLVRTFVGLAIVIGVIYGIYWILKQVKASREERSSGSGLAPLATLPLGPNRALHMVRAGHGS
jgi:flagellar protein FliO/FliZ